MNKCTSSELLALLQRLTNEVSNDVEIVHNSTYSNISPFYASTTLFRTGNKVIALDIDVYNLLPLNLILPTLYHEIGHTVNTDISNMSYSQANETVNRHNAEYYSDIYAVRHTSLKDTINNLLIVNNQARISHEVSTHTHPSLLDRIRFLQQADIN